jgi:hypothetical protein
MSDTHKPALWKQAAGAIVGGVIAMAAYGVYKTVTPVLASLTTAEPPTQEEAVRDALYQDIATRARAISDALQSNP